MNIKKIIHLFLTLLTCVWFNLSLASNIPIDDLSHEILRRIARVDSFDFIAKQAQKLGVRAYLFGGSASAYAHYVHWDLMREAGDARFHADRFTYAYVDIFRSNQDMDIVLDGPEEAARVLERLLAERFPFFQGNKSVWEVRLLKAAHGDKEALLNNPDFMNQHTDSNSTGLIELSLDYDHAQIRDLRDWGRTRDCQFLIDVQAQKIHYYFSKKHETTSRFKQGMNPPILSVIRYLTKAFQYELAIDAETKVLFKQIIADFSYQDLNNSYVKKWINNNGKKLYQNAVNLEYASKTLEELGLKQKLKVVGDIKNIEDLAWWMNKGPLRSRPLGQGAGATAAELGIDIVAHETNNFAAWESIVKSHENVPNVFISREGGNGEMAYRGDGFYTRIGRQGARGTGLTIRFKLHPEARNGADFEYIQDDGYVLIKNKQALEVIHEDLNWTPIEYFEKIMSGLQFDHTDKAVMYKLKQKILKQVTGLDPAEVQQLNHKVQVYFEHPEPYKVAMLYQEWLSYAFPGQYTPTYLQYLSALQVELKTNDLDASMRIKLKKSLKQQLSALSKMELAQLDQQVLVKLNAPREIKTIAEFIDYRLADTSDTGSKLNNSIMPWLLEYEFLKSEGTNISSGLKHIVETKNGGGLRYIIMSILSDNTFEMNPTLLGLVIEKSGQSNLNLIPSWVFKNIDLHRVRPQLLSFIERAGPEMHEVLVDNVFSKPENFDLLTELRSLVESADTKTLSVLAKRVLGRPGTEHMQDLVTRILEKSNPEVRSDLAIYTFSQPHTEKMQPQLKLLIKMASEEELLNLVYNTFTKPHAHSMEEPIKMTIEKGGPRVLACLADYVFIKDHTNHMTQALTMLVERGDNFTLVSLASKVFSKPHTANLEHLILRMIERGDQNVALQISRYVLSRPHAHSMGKAMRVLIEKGSKDVRLNLAEHTFSQPHTQNRAAEIKLLIDLNDPYLDERLIYFVFTREHTRHMRENIRALITRVNTKHLDEMLASIFANPHTKYMETELLMLIKKADFQLLNIIGRVFVKEHTQDMPRLKKIRHILKTSHPTDWTNQIKTYMDTLVLNESASNDCLRRGLLQAVDIVL